MEIFNRITKKMKPEIDTKDLILPSIVTYNQYREKTKEDLEDKIVKDSEDREFVQLCDKDKNGYSLVDLAISYNKLYSNVNSLLVFAKSTDKHIEFYFIRTENPFEMDFLKPSHLYISTDDREWGNDEAIKKKVKYATGLYTAGGEITVLIADEKSKRYIDNGYVSLDNEAITTLFNSTPIIRDKKQIDITLYKHIVLFGFIPLLAVNTLFGFINNSLIGSKKERSEELRKEFKEINKKLIDKKELLDASIEALENKKELYDNRSL